MSITPSGILVGAGLMYFLDAARGRRRRVRVGDLLDHVRSSERDLLGKAYRDASNRARGLVERIRHRPEEAAPDAVVEGRVRAQLGRCVSHPGALEIGIHAGCVVVRGPILEYEADALIHRLHEVPGVREVVDGLERHATAERIPALQGAAFVRGDRSRWSASAQGGAVLGGAALIVWGLANRRRLAIVSGGLLALRGALNMPISRFFGAGHGGVDVHKTIVVHESIDRVFDLWCHFENFPRFMEHVRSVRVYDDDRRRSQWSVDGPAGTAVTFEAEVVHLESRREIAWRTLPDQPIAHAGVVRFEPAAGGTRVHIDMTYRPPGGMFGHAIAHALGWDPKARLDDDLVRMKALLEDGRTRAHGERVELADLH